MEFILITLPGLSKIVKRELILKNIENVKELSDSRVLVDSSFEKLAKLRTIEGVAKVLNIYQLDEISTRSIRLILRNFFREYNISNLLKEGMNLKVATFPRQRFSRYFLKLIALRELKRVYGDFKETRHGKTLRIDLINDLLILGIDLLKHLYQRDYTTFKHPAMLNPLIASALAIILNIKREDIVVDPFVGSGTILIEATLLHNCEGFGFDINYDYVKGAYTNSIRANVDSKVSFFTGDISRIRYSRDYEVIITDPPRGIRIKVDSIKRIYVNLYEFIKKSISKGGRIGLATPYEDIAVKLAKDFKIELRKECTVLQGGKWISLMKGTIL